jgi:hypothetical protein
MRSFISSFKGRRRDAVLHLAFGGWVIAALIGFAAVSRPAAARTADIVSYTAPPPWGDFYLAHDRGGHIDHHVLFHGIDLTARQHLRRADVLFLGNSRLMFALDPVVLRQGFAALGRRYYVLGFGHEEQDDFPLEIIRNEDLRPSVAVINADHFFASEQSEWAARVIDESDFDAWKIRIEGEAAHRVRRVLHRLVPHYVDLHRGQREVVLFRSREDGTWFVANDFGAGVAFAWPPADRDQPDAETLRTATAFKRDLEARGTRMVLCLVPAPNVSLSRAQAIAAHLGVPLIVPEAGTPRSIDGSHLAHDSAVRVATSLLEQLQPLLR